jgi:tetratricopeptide (TPR) repeat protein
VTSSASSQANSYGGCRSLLVLFVLIGIVYGNSLHAIWVLDDYPNILQNHRMHIEDLLPGTLYQRILSPHPLGTSGALTVDRPIARLSFALNWYFSQDSPVGYRLVNIGIHILNAYLLFLGIRILLTSPNMRGKFSGSADSVALLGAALWAVNPIQTQAVIYVVQRMASLACFFYMLAIWSYLQARMSEERTCQILFYLISLVSFLFGVGSKENTILLPVSLILLEITFLQDFRLPKVRRRFGYTLAAGIGVLLMSGGWLLAAGKLSSCLDYSGRLFSPWERLLTEPRILIFYLSQIFYPIPTRLSIDHDVDLSRSIFEPWTTFPAILAVLALIVFAILWIRRRPFLSFAIIFFFLNHIIESSVIGLELIFEHRNYLPSLFLFVPVACGFQWLIDHYRARSQQFRHVITSFAVLLIVGFGMSTHIRIMDWLDVKVFWEDAVRKAPLSMRAIHNLAYEYYEKNGYYQTAFELYRKELTLIGYNRRDLCVAHVNLANHHYRIGDLAMASDHLDQALAIMPNFELVKYQQAFVLSKTEHLKRALDIVRSLVEKRPLVIEYNYLAAQILMKMNIAEEAVGYLRRCLKLTPGSAQALRMTGIALNLSGNFRRAEWFLTRALERLPGDKRTLLWMIDCKLQTSEAEAAVKFALQFLEGIPVNQIEASIQKNLNDHLMLPESVERLSRWIGLQMHEWASRKFNYVPG